MDEQDKRQQQQQQPQEGQPETQHGGVRRGDASTAQNREQTRSSSQGAPDQIQHADEVTGEGTGARGGEYS
ncbi:MAG TPA: hypothetical protein VGX92_22250 [Pyrinomonadaceae bacterium]|jgi:hypothetical protein|nr:hypothetical protein [Pyrinomonadaceae bacterium]